MRGLWAKVRGCRRGLHSLVIVVLFHSASRRRCGRRPGCGRRACRSRAHPRKGRIVPILVVIDPLPGPIRIVPQRVPDFDDRLERGQRQHLVRHRHAATVPAETFKNCYVTKNMGIPPSVEGSTHTHTSSLPSDGNLTRFFFREIQLYQYCCVNHQRNKDWNLCANCCVLIVW